MYQNQTLSSSNAQAKVELAQKLGEIKPHEYKKIATLWVGLFSQEALSEHFIQEFERNLKNIVVSWIDSLYNPLKIAKLFKETIRIREGLRSAFNEEFSDGKHKELVPKAKQFLREIFSALEEIAQKVIERVFTLLNTNFEKERWHGGYAEYLAYRATLAKVLASFPHEKRELAQKLAINIGKDVANFLHPRSLRGKLLSLKEQKDIGQKRREIFERYLRKYNTYI